MGSIADILIEDNDGWFSLNYFKGIFHVDLETGISKPLCDEIVEDKEVFTERIVKVGQFIFVLPIGEINEVVVYDVVKRNSFIIYMDIRGKCYIDNGFIKDSFLFLINNWSVDPSILVYDIYNFTLINKIELDRGRVWASKKEGRVFSKDIVTKDDVLVLASASSCYIIKIDLCTFGVEYVYIKCNLSGFVVMCNSEEDYWFADERAQCIRWNSKKVDRIFDLEKLFHLRVAEDEEMFTDYPGYKNSYMYFNRLIYSDKKVFLIPGRANSIIKLDTETNEWSEVYKNEHKRLSTSWISTSYNYGENIYVCRVDEKQLITINKKTGTVKIIPLIFEWENTKLVLKSQTCYEKRNSFFSLSYWVKCSSLVENVQKCGTKGRDIYNELIQ